MQRLKCQLMARAEHDQSTRDIRAGTIVREVSHDLDAGRTFFSARWNDRKWFQFSTPLDVFFSDELLEEATKEAYVVINLTNRHCAVVDEYNLHDAISLGCLMINRGMGIHCNGAFANPDNVIVKYRGVEVDQLEVERATGRFPESVRHPASESDGPNGAAGAV